MLSGDFKRELSSELQRRRSSRLGYSLSRNVRDTARELEGTIQLPHARRRAMAFKGYAKSFDVRVRESLDPRAQLERSANEIRAILTRELREHNGVKFVKTLVVTFIKRRGTTRELKRKKCTSQVVRRPPPMMVK